MKVGSVAVAIEPEIGKCQAQQHQLQHPGNASQDVLIMLLSTPLFFPPPFIVGHLQVSSNKCFDCRTFIL